MPVNYNLGRIYKLESYQTEDFYIGSTCQPLCERLAQHKSHYKCFQHGKGHYRTSYEILKYPDAKITLIEYFPCNSKEELEAREGKWIRELNRVNKRIEGRTKKEYCKEHSEKLAKTASEWHQKNREKHLKQMKYYNQARKIDQLMQNVNEITNKLNLILSK